MSDLTATNCGCGCDNGNNGCCSTLIWLLLLTSCCGNGNGFFGGNGCGNDNSCLWLILILCCCGGCGNGGFFGNNGCGCGNGCGCQPTFPGAVAKQIDYSSILQQPLKFMVKNKVVLKERDARSDLANFIGEKKYKNIC